MLPVKSVPTVTNNSKFQLLTFRKDQKFPHAGKDFLEDKALIPVKVTSAFTGGSDFSVVQFATPPTAPFSSLPMIVGRD